MVQTRRLAPPAGAGVTGRAVEGGTVPGVVVVPGAAVAMLACARIGAVHSVVFAGFSAEALAQRVSAAQSKILITADIGKRGGNNATRLHFAAFEQVHHFGGEAVSFTTPRPR